MKISSRKRARVLISGTLAYDVLGRTSDRLDPGVRNVKLDGVHQDFGGCAMNVAYTLTGLGLEPIALAYVGEDFAPTYADHLKAAGVRTDALILVPGQTCARGITLTDPRGVQFTAFFPGPTGSDRVVQDLERLCRQENFDAVVLAPDLPNKVAAAAPAVAHLPLRVWCPGQYAQHFTAEQIVPLLQWADLVILNRFEWRSLYQTLRRGRVAHGEHWLHASSPAVIVTRGASAVVFWSPGQGRTCVPVKQVPTSAQQDPTGCGDALTAGVIAGLLTGLTPAQAIEHGIGAALLCLAEQGTQRHRAPTAEVF
ncbi:MAG: PfkB family carbohydrate kinase [Pseudomonadales bacterium]